MTCSTSSSATRAIHGAVRFGRGRVNTNSVRPITSVFIPSAPSRSLRSTATFPARQNMRSPSSLSNAPTRSSGSGPCGRVGFHSSSQKLNGGESSTGGNAGHGNGNSAPTLSPAEYETVSERDMDKLHEALEVLCEEIGPTDWEVEYSSGVMTLSLPPHGTYVINKQPPNAQIWISSPVSGPGRFDYLQEGQSGWVHHRNSKIRLDELLDTELRELLEKAGKDQSTWNGVHL